MPGKPGRKPNSNLANLGFLLKKDNRKYFAVCTICRKELKNTAGKRLQMHRNTCNYGTKSITPNTNSGSDDARIEDLSGCIKFEFEEAFVTQDPLNDDEPTTSKNQNFNATTVDEDTSQPSISEFPLSFSSSSPHSNIYAFPRSHFLCEDSKNIKNASSLSNSCQINTPVKRKWSILPQLTNSASNLADKRADKEEIEIHNALAKLIFGCNLPLRIIESLYFKNFIEKIRPGYANKMPGRVELSTTLLNKTYNENIAEAKRNIDAYSVLSIVELKDSSKDTKTFVTMIHNTDGQQAFLHAEDITDEPDFAEAISKLVNLSIDKAKMIYSTDIFAMVSNNTSAVAEMEKSSSHRLWHITCSSHSANLLAQNILKQTVTENVLWILTEFRKPSFEKYIIENSGIKIKLPCNVTWCSHTLRDAYNCLVRNFVHMQFIASDSNFGNVSQFVKKLIFDEQFIRDVKRYATAIEPICELLKKCQKQDFSIADAANEWLDLRLSQGFNTIVEVRKKEALNVYALTAYYLHPIYDNNKLSSEQISEVNDFLFENLDEDGLEEWHNYRERKHFFRNLFDKNIKKPSVFWNMAELKQPILAKLAKQLLLIPSSSAQIKKHFSSWAHAHSPECNRLNSERSEKIMHLYYSLKNSDPDFDGCDFVNLD